MQSVNGKQHGASREISVELPPEACDQLDTDVFTQADSRDF